MSYFGCDDRPVCMEPNYLITLTTVGLRGKLSCTFYQGVRATTALTFMQV